MKLELAIVFLEHFINFFRKSRGARGVDVIKCNFDKITSRANCSKVVYSLMSSVSVVCCQRALYQFDYLDFVAEQKLSDDGLCDLPTIEPNNCFFYVENDLEDFDKICLNCKIWFV